MTQPVVAVINSNDDLVKILRNAFIREGLDVVTAHIRDFKAGKLSFPDFLDNHDPAVVIYDISIPDEDNWTFLQTLLALPESRARDFVITTVNKRVLDRRIGRSEAIEIQGGRADDLDPVIEAVQKKLQRRTGTHAR